MQYLADELLERNLVQATSGDKWRTGLMRREFKLTFVGTIFYLDMVGTKKKLGLKRYLATVRSFVKFQGSWLGYAPFTEFDEIDEALGKEETDKIGIRAVEVFCSIARLLLAQVGQLVPCVWNVFTFKSWGFGTRRPNIITETEEKEKQEEAWKEGFASILLDFYLRHQSPQVWRNNPNLNTFYGEMLRKQEKRKREELERIVIDRNHLQRYRKLAAALDAT